MKEIINLISKYLIYNKQLFIHNLIIISLTKLITEFIYNLVHYHLVTPKLRNQILHPYVKLIIIITHI